MRQVVKMWILINTLVSVAFVSCEVLDQVKETERLVCGYENTCGMEPNEPFPAPSFAPLIDIDSIVFTPNCCGSCSCNQTVCEVEDTCCLDVLTDLPSPEESLSLKKMTCEYPQFRPFKDGIYNAAVPVKMLRQCTNNRDPVVLDKCEHPDRYLDVYTKVPVTDRSTLWTYQNKFCAACNDISEDMLVFWKMEIFCSTGTYQPSVSDLSLIFQDILQTEDCNVKYDVPNSGISDFRLPSCSKVVSACNETGLWDFYDPVIETACLAYTSLYNYKYKNMFCYICNTPSDREMFTACMSSGGPFIFESFSALLKLPPEETDEDDMQKCSSHEIYDPVKVNTPISIPIYTATHASGFAKYVLPFLYVLKESRTAKKKTDG